MHDIEERIRTALRTSGGAFEPAQPISLPRVHERAGALRTRILVSTLIVALLIASGAFLIVHAVSNPQPGSFIAPHHEPNIKIAQAEVERLQGIVKLPPGSRQTTAPRGTGGNDSGGRSNYISGMSWWTVPMAQGPAFEWIFHHHPPGLHLSGWGTIPAPGVSWADAATRAYTQPEVDVEIRGLSKTLSRVQIIASAIWLTDQPATDPVAQKSGRPIHVTMAGGCPRSVQNTSDVSNAPSPILRNQLLYLGNPIGALRCVYAGSDALISSTRLSSSQAASLAKTIKQLNLGSPGTGFFYNCPEFGGASTLPSAEILVFQYRGNPDLDLWHSFACIGVVDNGFIMTSLSVAPF